jgi:hypothetical protein
MTDRSGSRDPHKNVETEPTRGTDGYTSIERSKAADLELKVPCD